MENKNTYMIIAVVIIVAVAGYFVFLRPTTPTPTPTPEPEPELAVQLIEVGFSDELGSPHDVFVSGNYAYIADSYNGLRVVDVSDPANPQQVGSFDPPGSRRAQGVYFSDPYLYVADGLGLLILDVSDPTAPFEVGFYHPPGFAVKVYPSDGYAFVADREGGLRIADVSDPANPKHVSNYFEPGSVHVLDVFVSGSYAYVAMGGLGLRIVDISDPANPQEVGFSDTEGVAARAMGRTVCGYSTSPTQLTRWRLVSMIHQPQDMPKMSTSQATMLS